VNVGLVLVAGRDVVDAVHPADHGLEGVDTSGDHIIWVFDGFLQYTWLVDYTPLLEEYRLLLSCP
jgi:hypothetical protein